MARAEKIDWLIVGGQGQFSLAMQRYLRDKGESFLALSRDDLDITSSSQVSNSLTRIAPRIVINGAAWTDVDAAEDNESRAILVNAKGVENLAANCANVGATLVHISTDYVFSGSAVGEYSETELPSPTSAYGRSKVLGEKAALSVSNLDSYIVRTAWLYSSNGRNFAKTILRKALFTNEDIKVVSDQWGQPTFANDLAGHIYQLVENNLPFGIYHGTNSGRATWYDFATEILLLADADPNRVIAIPSSAYVSKVARPTNSVLGHANWRKSGLAPMRDWRHALAEAMPSIIEAVKMRE